MAHDVDSTCVQPVLVVIDLFSVCYKLSMRIMTRPAIQKTSLVNQMLEKESYAGCDTDFYT